MKYELLKRTVMALFVGGVVSSYTLAVDGEAANEQPADELENQVEDIASVVDEIGKDVNKVGENLNGLVDLHNALVDDVNDALSRKVNVDDVYNKSESDSKFVLKSNSSDRFNHLDNRVNKLDKDLKRGLAAQAALTGLFQPYTVGKANFTAAVGGYKSQTAVAVGTGYRYNQNIATKAGVAFTQGGGVTYNAGVNFEW